MVYFSLLYLIIASRRPSLHQSPSMPPSMMNEPISQSMLIDNNSGKMTKSATGAHISPLITSTASMASTVTVSAAPPTSGNAIGGGMLASNAVHNPNFPRGTRNRQTFHGKTEHTKVRVYGVYQG